MRTIKFRAKHIMTGEWLYGSHYDDCGEEYILPNQLNSAVDYEDYQVNPNTVGQFTGLTDVNGKEIYEGDIIVQHSEDMPDIRGAVVCDEANARFGMSYTCHWESGAVTHFDTLERVKCYADCNRELTYEVIGNIHDNQDLMLAKDINIFKCEM